MFDHRLSAARDACPLRPEVPRLRLKSLPLYVAGALLVAGSLPARAHGVLPDGAGCGPLHGLAVRTAACDHLPADLATVVDRVMARTAPAGFRPAGQPPRRHPLPPARGAAVVPVTTCADAGPGSLRAAIDTAVSGDAIDLTKLACSVITLTTGTLVAEVEELTINGPGADRLAISGNDAATVLVHAGGEEVPGMLSLNGVSIVNGRNQYGTMGGCVFAYGDLVLTDATIDSCHAQRVAGALVRGDLTMTGSRITRTTSATTNYLTFGGGALVYGGATIIDSTISGNHLATSSTIGGAMAAGLRVQGGDLTVIRSEFSDNTVEGRAVVAGAGIWTHSGNVLIVDSLIRGNILSPLPDSLVPQIRVGAGIAVHDGDLTVIGSTIRNNVANSAFNGGIHIQQLYDTTRIPSVYVGNSTLSMNFATWGAGGLGSWQTHGFTLRNSTVFGNRVAEAFENFGSTGFLLEGSGGVWHQSDEAVTRTIDVASSILYGNSRNDTGARADLGVLSDWGTGHVDTIAVTGGHNLIGAASAAVLVPADTLDADPLLQPLADNGGPTPTHALADSSPAIDAGDAGSFDFDQRGPAFPRTAGAATDIGAIEWVPGVPADRIFAHDFEPAGPN